VKIQLPARDATAANSMMRHALSLPVFAPPDECGASGKCLDPLRLAAGCWKLETDSRLEGYGPQVPEGGGHGGGLGQVKVRRVVHPHEIEPLWRGRDTAAGPIPGG